MKKNILITFILIVFICNINLIMSSVRDASLLFFNKIFISTFPFMILGDILFYFDYHLFLSNTFIGKLMAKSLCLNKYEVTVFLFSIFTSQPNNAVYIKKLLDDKIIDIDCANKLLVFTYFPSISFVIGSIGIIMFNSLKIGLFLYLNVILNNVIICLFLKKTHSYNLELISLKKDTFINVIKSSIIKTFNNQSIILGNLILFSILLNLINSFIKNDFILIVISALLEITNSLNFISILNINLFLKLFLCAFCLNFSGLSILFQSFSILSEYNLNIKKILIIKLIFSLISSFISILLLGILYFHHHLYLYQNMLMLL